MAKVTLRTYNREIESMIDRGQLDEAIAHCQHILKTFPKHLETYRLLGKAYLEYKRFDDAVDIFSRVLAADPSDFVANVGMSLVRDEQNKLDDALWHMERAFEVQSANPAIQGELQRLYGRRDGVQPPRIRMTRGALAHMYMRGELYPQAISEIKSVLEEDTGRSDMQILLALAYYRSGQKTQAADEASSILRRYQYSLNANRLLTEILSVERPETAQTYRQRVIELDPYAAQVSGSIFESAEVGDNAVVIEHLEWNGQPVGVQSDWSSQAIGLESDADRDQQPDWLKQGIADSTPPQTSQTTVPPLPASTPSTEMPLSSAPVSAEPTPEEDIPDFLRAAGWGASTGAFDESKSTFADESEEALSHSAESPLEQGDLPDWVKAMAPTGETQSAQPTNEEDLPDWIRNIGTGALPSAGTAADDQLDWLKESDQTEATQQPVTDEQPDWMKGVGQEESSPQPAADEQPDWIKGFDEPVAEQSASDDQGDEQMDWLSQLGNESQEETMSAGSEFDFLDQEPEPKQPPAAQEPPVQQPTPTETPIASTGGLGTSQQDIDDSLAWLENLAAKQGATEGLLVNPEDRKEQEPDWVKQAKSEPTAPPQQTPVAEPPAQQPSPTASTSTSQQDIDDSLAWLENLAAKQGATEGLLVNPEDRKEQEPDWVKQAKSEPQQPPVQRQPAAPAEEVQPPLAAEPQPPVAEPLAQQPSPTASTSTSQQDIDDSLAWLENLAAKQGATEGLLVNPEDRKEQEPDWVKQAKSEPQQPSVQQQPATPIEEVQSPVAEPPAQQPAPVEETPQPVAQEPPISEPQGVEAAPPQHTSTADDTAAWLRSLEEEGAKVDEPAESVDDTAMWLKTLEEPDEPIQAAQASSSDDLPTWLQDVDEEQVPATEAAVSGTETVGEADRKTEEPVASQEPEPAPAKGDIPSWLEGISEENEQPAVSEPDQDLPAWLRDDTGEAVAEPTKIEPTRSSDWKPAEAKQEQPPAPPPVVQAKPEPVVPEPQPKLESKPKPARKVPVKTESLKPTTPPEPYKEPITRRGTGMLAMPVDPILGSARNELSRSNIPGALEAYEKLIKKGRFLEDVIRDLRDALDRYPVEISIWQSLGDAYMRANQLQDALDAYTKAEELLR